MKRIHPYDAYLLLMRLETIYLIKKGEAEALPDGQFMLDGELYEQTTEVQPSKEAMKALTGLESR